MMYNQNEKNYLIHYGNKNSGRYPRGSGENPHQHDGQKIHKPMKRGAIAGATIAGVPAAAYGGWVGSATAEIIGGLSGQSLAASEIGFSILYGAGIAALPAAAIGGAIGLAGGAIVKHIMNKKKGQ